MPAEVATAPAEVPCAEVELFGVRLHALSAEQCVSHIASELAAGRGGWVVTPNLDHLRRLLVQRSFRELCARASLCVADGMPLLWASQLQGTPLPGRVAGSDLIFSVSAAAARERRRVFFLGGDAGTAEKAARVLEARFPGLVVAGVHCPPFGFEKNRAHMSCLTDEIVRARPDVVFVALGSPKQEILIDELCSHLPHAWWLGIGISFSFVCGAVRRAPPWMQKSGLEWLHRLVQEPRRLARRYLLEGLPFAAYVLCRSAWRGLLVRHRRWKHTSARMHSENAT